MNKTQRVIILTGDDKVVNRALETIRGFKAISVIRKLSSDVVKNVFWHNKNALYVAKNELSIELIHKYSPVVIKCQTGKSEIDKLQLGLENVMKDFPDLLDSLDIDSGDHISKDSHDLGDATKKNCFLCKVVEGHPDKPEHILYESQNFIVIPGEGAFFDGYTMIVPKKHIMSFAALSEDEYIEFLQVLNDMRFILQSVYGKKVFAFECSSGKNGGGKHETSIVHAHFHLAPIDMPVLREIHKSGLYPAQIEPMDVVKTYEEYPYMLYIDQDDNWYITSDPKTYFPRQHPRQVIADYMGLEKGKYNWRIYPMRERMDVIADEIYSFLKREFNNLPVWIREATKKYLP